MFTVHIGNSLKNQPIEVHYGGLFDFRLKIDSSKQKANKLYEQIKSNNEYS